MRSEKEIFDLILNFATENNLVKVVLLNGSRANPNAKKDFFMDYDLIYVVENTKPFVENKSWIKYFGEILIMQEPDDPNLFIPEFASDEKYTYLIQFKDTNRIDMTFETLEFAKTYSLKDSQTIILLDKNNLLPKLLPPSDKSYHIKEPSQDEFSACCNEFWWVSCYVAKGLWRKQIIYSLEIFNQNVHPEFMKMLRWFIGTDKKFGVSTGKFDKDLDKFLPRNIYQDVLKTYPIADTENVWLSLKIMCDLFNEIALYVAGKLHFQYNNQESENAASFIFNKKICIDNKI